MNNKSPVTLSHLQRVAKKLQKEKSLKWQKALDEAAKQFGYSNYKIFLNERNQSEQSVESLLKKIFSEKGLSKKALQSLCKKSTLNEDIQSFLLNDLRADEGGEIEIYAPNFIAREVSLKNLIYKIKGDKLYVEGDYELTLEFDGEVPDEHKHLPHFNRPPMFGDFEIKIDKNNKITFEDSSIGWNEG